MILYGQIVGEYIVITVFKNGQVYDSDKRSFVSANLLVRDGMIESVGSFPIPADASVVDCAGHWLLPGLVDVHTHGRGGYDFTAVDSDAVRILRRSYAATGTTTVMATLASAPMDALVSCIDAINDNRAPEAGLAHVGGIHLEGRYLNPKRRGAHAEELLALPDAAELEGLLRRMMPLPVHISCAAELDGGESFVKAARALGATVGLAHSDATWEEAERAVSWGVTSFTHTYNAMRPIHHREPGNMVASLLADDCYSEFICDGEHSHPAMIRLAARAKDAAHLVLITDSLEAAGCPDGHYSIAGMTVIVTNGRAVTTEGALAGSTLDLFTALVNFMRFTGLTLEEALPCVTANPAAMVGLDNVCGSLKPGRYADLIMIRDKEAPAPESVWIMGQRV